MSSQFDKNTNIWFRFEHIFILQNYNCQWAQAQKLRAPSPPYMVTLPTTYVKSISYTGIA